MEKNKKVKEQTINEENEIKRFMIILGTIVVLVIGVFIFTKYAVNDGDIKLPIIYNTPGTVNPEIVVVGTMLNRPEENYYVMVYDSSVPEAISYADMIAKGQENEDIERVYFLDLSDKVNEDYLATETRPENTKANSIEDLSFGKVTLIKVEDGKIAKYITDLEKIEDELVVKES